jgi:hypothetical protein
LLFVHTFKPAYINMATVATHRASIPSFNRTEPGSLPLTQAELPLKSTVKAPTDASKVAEDWVASFNRLLASGDDTAVSNLFLDESYWRDQLCFSWDFHTLKGPSGIAAFLNEAKRGKHLASVSVDDTTEFRAPKATPIDPKGEVDGVTAFLNVKTEAGKGIGLVRLVQDRDNWKAFTFFTTLRQLEGHEELMGGRRPAGVEHGEHRGRKNWQDRRKAAENLDEGDPTVLILGT